MENLNLQFKKTLIFLICIWLFPQTVISQSTWQQSETNTNYYLYTIYFINSSTGFTAGSREDSSKLFKTTDEGNSWDLLSSYYKTPLRNIFFLNEETGFISTNYGTYMQTGNSGITWQNKRIGTFKDLIQIIFFNRDTGIAISIDSVFLTENSGLNWINIGLPVNPEYLSLFEMCFINSTTGFISSKYGIDGYTFKTTNGGRSWNISLFTYTIQTGIHFFDFNYGILIGGIYCNKTTNGGMNWSNGSYISIIGIDGIMISPSEIYAVGSSFGNAKIVRSSNSGVDWYTDLYVEPPEYVAFRNIIYKSNILWVCGDEGLVYKKAIKTNLWGTEKQFANSFHLFQNYPNPFNPVTKISYELQVSSYASLNVYDMLGKEVVTLVNQRQNAGRYSVEWNAENLPSGIYFCKLEAGNFTEVIKMILLK